MNARAPAAASRLVSLFGSHSWDLRPRLSPVAALRLVLICGFLSWDLRPRILPLAPGRLRTNA
jgi:hypothetical protein